MHGTSNIFVAILTIAMLVSLTGYQVTSETSAVRMLGRLGAALIELDRWLPAHRDDIQLAARDRPTEPLVLSDLPIQVAIPAAAALEAPEPVLRATITEATGRRLYERGRDAIQNQQGNGRLAFTEPLRWAVDMLDGGTHSFWQLALAITGLALLAISVAHFWTRQSPLPGLTVGSAIAASLALLAWLAVTALTSSAQGALNEEIALVARDGLWLGVRNSLAATAIGIGGLYAYHSLIGHREPERWDEWDDFDYESQESAPREAPPY